MSEIETRWRGSDGAVWSLGVIDRARSTQMLEEQIRDLDEIVEKVMRQARLTQGGLERLPLLRRALARLGEREAKNADLRVVRIDGRGLPAPISIDEVLILVEGVQKS